jgi:Protein of unknown function (DUF3151)
MSLTGSPSHRDLLGGPPPTLLPDEVGPRELLEGGAPAAEVAAAHPTSSLAWALLAEGALDRDAVVEAYAYARTGYHRGLDALRRAGWRGQGPIPADHAPNQGFLRALLALSQAAHRIGEEDEAERCATFLTDSGTSVDEVRALTSTTK